MDDVDIYGNRRKVNENSSLNGERIEIIRSLVSVYERRLKRFQEELKLLTDLTEFQYAFINKLGITPNNMKLSPNKNQKTEKEELSNSFDEFSNENGNVSNDENGEIDNDTKKNNSPAQNNRLSHFSLSTESFLNFLKKSIERSDENTNIHSIHDIFQKFPIFESAFFDEDFSFDIQPICEYIQTLTQEKRQEFYSEIWISMNNITYFMNSFFSLLKSDSFHSLSELIEKTLSRSLNYSHTILYTYDSEKSLLIIEKEKVKISHTLNDGLILNAIKNNQPVLVDRNDPNIKFDDLNIMVKHKKAFFIPIPESSAVLAFFDKIDNFTPQDILIALSSSSVINKIYNVLQLQKRTKDVFLSFQRMSDIFIELSSISNFKDFYNIMAASLTKTFKCSKLILFEVSQPSQSFCRYDINDSNDDNSIQTDQTSFPIGHGIIGYSIVKKSVISLPRAEFSILFESDSDRPENGYKVESILSCPVLNNDGEVNWSIVLYNKQNSDNFTKEDVSCIEIFAQFFHSVLSAALTASKITDEVKLSNWMIEDMNEIVDFISTVTDLNEITNITSQITKKLQKFSEIDQTEIYTVNNRLNCIVGPSLKRESGNNGDDDIDKDDIYIQKVKAGSNDLIINFTLSNQIRQAKDDQSKTKIYCPLVGSSEKVVGLMVLTSKEEESNVAQSSKDDSSQSVIHPFSFSKKNKKQSKLQKKLSGFAQKNLSTFSIVSNSRMRKIFPLLGKTVGELVEVFERAQKCKQLILTYERLNDSLHILNHRTIAYLYPQIVTNFHVEGLNRSEETKPVSCFNLNDDLAQNFVSFVHFLNGFPIQKNCNYFDLVSMKKEAAKKDDKRELSSKSIEFPLSNSFDVFQFTEKVVFSSLISAMRDLGILSYLRFDKTQIQTFINCIRNLHLNKVFKNWELSIDRIQFLNFFLKKLNLLKKFSCIQKVALFLYLISMNCDPVISVNDSNCECEVMKSKYFLENGSSLNVATTVFFALSSMPDSPFFLMKKEEQNLVFDSIESLEIQLNEVDSSLSSDLFVLTALICSFSYLAREINISQNWVKLRFDEELSVDEIEFREELMKYQLEFEMRVLIQPAFAEFTKNDLKVDEIRNHFTDSINKMTAFNFK